MWLRGDQVTRGHVVTQNRDAEGNAMGRAHSNSILDTRLYYKIPWGQCYQMNYQCHGRINLCPVWCRREWVFVYGLANRPLEEQEGNIPCKPENLLTWQRVTWKLTTGWKICCLWKNGSTLWEKLSNVKESYLVQTDEFAIKQVIDHECAFNSWDKHMLKKWDRIVASVRKRQVRYLKKAISLV